jgi:hypothetical protein
MPIGGLIRLITHVTKRPGFIASLDTPSSTGTPSLTPQTLLDSIARTILDEARPREDVQQALDHFSQLCSEVAQIRPDATYEAWSGDIFLESGVAINPEAAAFCIQDYQRSTMFIRGVFAAIKAAQRRFSGVSIKILYAGCGPFATQLLPLLNQFTPGELDIVLLDIHPRSLESVNKLLRHFGFERHKVRLIHGDACNYQHPERLHIILAETMQKSLEQEPQFAVTANLAPQLDTGGFFIPQQIEVALCLADMAHEKEQFKNGKGIDTTALNNSGKRILLGKLFTLCPEDAAEQMKNAVFNQTTSRKELTLTTIDIPHLGLADHYDALFFTRIQVYNQYQLNDYESEITLPTHCHELATLKEGDRFTVSYQLGSYPKFELARIS